MVASLVTTGWELVTVVGYRDKDEAFFIWESVMRRKQQRLGVGVVALAALGVMLYAVARQSWLLAAISFLVALVAGILAGLTRK